MEGDIGTRESAIRAARKQLEKDKAKATTKEDSLLITERENLLNAAMFELNGAKKLIEMQKEEISIQRRLLVLFVCSVLLLAGFLFNLYRHSKEKRRTHLLLKEKTKKITDSINYAQHIQQSILPQESEVKKVLPDSFIYFQPRDIVSGDFYWISEIEHKIIIAAVDCTGHGVPGAFMSLIGNTLLNEIINEKGIIEPATILKQLHTGILKSLHQHGGDMNCQDGMEMSLCVIDDHKKTIDYAGAMNPIYVVKDGLISIIKPDIQAIGGINSLAMKDHKIEFTTRLIPIEEKMTVYMFTDGYMDQFGGPENKKFNSPKFKKLLVDIQALNMEEQKQAVEQAMKDWKGEYRQIDDMLVIGLRF
jgi:serine phosphatase RsbU (regulator of sigma subunit)